MLHVGATAVVYDSFRVTADKLLTGTVDLAYLPADSAGPEPEPVTGTSWLRAEWSTAEGKTRDCRLLLRGSAVTDRPDAASPGPGKYAVWALVTQEFERIPLMVGRTTVE